MMIYHIVTENDFRSQIEGDTYTPASLEAHGFVHCALQSSVIPVANDYYAEVSQKLLLLEIDPQKLYSETRYEPAAPLAGVNTSHVASIPHFPHVYGPIETTAITQIGILTKEGNSYQWPTSLEAFETFYHSPQA